MSDVLLNSLFALSSISFFRARRTAGVASVLALLSVLRLPQVLQELGLILVRSMGRAWTRVILA